MKLKGKKVGVAFTGSFCTYEKAFEQLRRLKEEGAEIVTVFSGASQTTDSRFGRAAWDIPPISDILRPDTAGAGLCCQCSLFPDGLPP